MYHIYFTFSSYMTKMLKMILAVFEPFFKVANVKGVNCTNTSF